MGPALERLRELSFQQKQNHKRYAMANLNSEKFNSSATYSPDSSSKKEYQDRRRVEMKRRFGLLQSRRSHLERELEAVKGSLISLDRQMKSYAAYEQLSMNT